MAKSFHTTGTNPLQPRVNQLATVMLQEARAAVLRSMPRRNALREKFEEVLGNLWDEVVDAVNLGFDRDAADSERLKSLVQDVVQNSTAQVNNTTYSREVKAAHRKFRQEIDRLFQGVHLDDAADTASRAEQDTAPTPTREVVAYTWEDQEAREAFMPDVLSSMVNSALDSFHFNLLNANPPVISEQEEITGTNRLFLAEFLERLQVWKERCEIRHFRGQSITLDQFKRRLETELDAVRRGILEFASSPSMSARTNKLHPDLPKSAEICVAQIVSQISPLTESSIFSGALENTTDTWNFNERFLPKTHAFLEERLVSDEYVPHVIEGAALRGLERFRKSHRGDLRPLNMQYALDMLNDDFHGDLTYEMGDKKVRAVMEPDLKAALALIERREVDEKIKEYLPGMLRYAAEQHAVAAVASLCTALEEHLLESQSGRVASLSSGASVTLVSMDEWQDEWQSLARSVAHTVLREKTAHVTSLPSAEIFQAAKSVLVDQAGQIHGDIVSAFQGKLASAHIPPAPAVVERLVPQAPSPEAFQFIVDASEQAGAYQFKSLSRTQVPLFRGRTSSEEFPVCERETALVYPMLRSYVSSGRFAGETIDDSVELIAQPGEVLETMAGQCNRLFHGGITFRRPADFKESAKNYLEGIDYNFRQPEREKAVIEREFGWLLEHDLWPTERELQRAMRAVASDVYRSRQPIQSSNDPLTPATRRSLLLAYFDGVPRIKQLAKWSTLPTTADEFDSNLREKLFTEAFEVDDFVRKLLEEKRPLAVPAMQELIGRVRDDAYHGQNIWHINDFEAFALREYRRLSEQQYPAEMLGAYAHSAVEEPSDYPHSSPHWLVERQLILDMTAELRSSSRWPTEREVHHVLRRVTEAISPHHSPDGSTLKSLREAILDVFDPGLSIRNLAEARPADIRSLGCPDEVLDMNRKATSREQAMIRQHVPAFAAEALRQLQGQDPDHLLARTAACRLLAEPRAYGVVDLEGEVRQSIYGGRTIWRIEDFREYVVRCIVNEVMILWPEQRRTEIASPVIAPVQEVPMVVQQSELADSNDTHTNIVGDFHLATSPELSVAVPFDPEIVRVSDVNTALPVQTVTPVSSLIIAEPPPSPPPASREADAMPAELSDHESVSGRALHLQGLLRDAYVRAHNGVPSVDVLSELEDRMDEAEATIREALTALPVLASSLQEQHAAAYEASVREDEPAAPRTQDIQLLRGYRGKLDEYIRRLAAAEASRGEWPSFRNSIRAHLNAVNGFLAFQKDFARIAGVDIDQIPLLLDLESEVNGADESLEKISALSERHHAISELMEEHVGDEFLNDEQRTALAQTIDRRLEALARQLTQLLELAAGGSAASVSQPRSPQQFPAPSADRPPSVLPLIPDEDQHFVHNLLRFTSGGVEAGNRGMGLASIRFMKSCEALGITYNPDFVFQNPDDPGFQRLLKYAVCMPEAQQAIDAWRAGLRKGQDGFPGGKASFPHALLKADALFILTLNTAASWAFTATDKGRLYAQQHGISLDQEQVDALAQARKVRNF